MVLDVGELQLKLQLRACCAENGIRAQIQFAKDTQRARQRLRRALRYTALT
jgi:hypothetical protein